jgi:hypothetical protein
MEKGLPPVHCGPQEPVNRFLECSALQGELKVPNNQKNSMNMTEKGNKGESQRSTQPIIN